MNRERATEADRFSQATEGLSAHQPVRSGDAAGRLLLIAFRYDDPSVISPMHLESRIIQIFAEARARHTFAVIPAIPTGPPHVNSPSQSASSLPFPKRRMLRLAVRTKKLEVAQHGFTHQTLRKGLRGDHSEFAGLPFGEQCDLIRQGRNRLQRSVGAPITTFVPPWNSYDENTTRALEELEFSVLSASIDGPWRDSQVDRAPGNCSLGAVRSAVELFRRSDLHFGALVVVYHPYDFTESGDWRGWFTLDRFGELVSWCAAQPDIRMLSLSDLAHARRRFTRDGASFGDIRLDLKQAYTERFFCASARKMLEIPLFLWLIEG